LSNASIKKPSHDFCCSATKIAKKWILGKMGRQLPRGFVQGRLVRDRVGHALFHFLLKSRDVGNALIVHSLPAVIERHRPSRRATPAPRERRLNACYDPAHDNQDDQDGKHGLRAPENVRHPDSPSAMTGMKWGGPRFPPPPGAVGVAVEAIYVQTIQSGFGDHALEARDLSLAFVMVAIVSSLSVLIFARLKPDAGAAVSGRMVSTSEERVAAAAE